MMMSLGVYVLDAADTAERRRVEAHLPTCPACRAELSRLAPLPALLADIPETMRDTARSPGRVAGSRPRPRSRSLPRAAAWPRWATTGVAACLAAAAVTSGFLLSAGSGGRGGAAETLSGTNPAAHVVATAILTPTSWGTSIQLQVRGLPENVECRLVVRSRDGQAEVSGAWNDWQHGPVSIPASASWRPSDIASLQVRTTTGNVVTISASQPATQAGRGVTS
jgi:hypothetical protein